MLHPPFFCLLPRLRHDLSGGQTALDQTLREGLHHPGRTGQVIGQGERFGDGPENSFRLDLPWQAVRAVRILFGEIAHMQARAALRGGLHLRMVDQLAGHFGEPFADTSAVPTNYISKVAREHVTVVLTGDGGDELLAGYNRYAETLRDRQWALPAPVRIPMTFASEHMSPGMRGRGYLMRWGSNACDRYLFNLTVFDPAYRHALRGRDDDKHPYLITRRTMKNPDLLTGLQLTDIALYLPDDINVKVDRMSMACSLEARAPFLDHKLAEFIGRLPRSYFHNKHQGKLILRQAMANILPPTILTRPKMGFGLPLADWMRNLHQSPARVFLEDANIPLYRLVDRKVVQTFLKEHENGRRDWSTQLWALMMLALWMQIE